ncbi:hypothetical protein JCM10212_001668 [Sporobolomyces blumeae]
MIVPMSSDGMLPHQQGPRSRVARGPRPQPAANPYGVRLTAPPTVVSARRQGDDDTTTRTGATLQAPSRAEPVTDKHGSGGAGARKRKHKRGSGSSRAKRERVAVHDGFPDPAEELAPEFVKQSTTSADPSRARWVQDVGCKEVTVRWPKATEWVVCEGCSEGDGACENRGVRTVTATGQPGLRFDRIESESLPTLIKPGGIGTLATYARRSLGYLKEIGLAFLTMVPPPRVMFRGSERYATDAVQAIGILRCDTCGIDIFPVGWRKGEKAWCGTCGDKELPPHPHPMILVHHELAESLSSHLKEEVTVPALPAIPPPGKVVGGSLPQIHHKRDLLKALRTHGVLVRRVGHRDPDLESIIEAHIDKGVPVVVARALGPEWDGRGRVWAELDKIEMNWFDEDGDKSGMGKEFRQKLERGENVRVADFPKHGSFAEAAPDTFEAFEELLPHPRLMSSTGDYNMASTKYPIENPSDLGPKGYFSSGKISTELHGRDRRDQHWDHLVNETLRTPEMAHPLQSFKIELTAADIKKLVGNGVGIYVFAQRVGDAVVINLKPAAKLAVDFVPAASMERSLRVQAERVKYWSNDPTAAGKGDLVRAPARIVSFLTEMLREKQSQA